jgi:large subunit ribosomal protein L24
MKAWSPDWKSSKSPRKQRKYRYNAPLHVRGRFLHTHLSRELRKKHNKRALRVRIDDKVAVVRGEFKKKSGKVVKVDLKNGKIFVEKIESQKKGGTKSYYPIEPSNVIITELNLGDKNRAKILERVK